MRRRELNSFDLACKDYYRIQLWSINYLEKAKSNVQSLMSKVCLANIEPRSGFLGRLTLDFGH
jgi:hypothetical protein